MKIAPFLPDRSLSGLYSSLIVCMLLRPKVGNRDGYAAKIYRLNVLQLSIKYLNHLVEPAMSCLTRYLHCLRIICVHIYRNLIMIFSLSEVIQLAVMIQKFISAMGCYVSATQQPHITSFVILLPYAILYVGSSLRSLLVQYIINYMFLYAIYMYYICRWMLVENCLVKLG